jgi:nucleoside-diphosphate-sugar epimerase
MTEETTTTPLSVFVTGATTGPGRAITRELVAQGYKVTGTATSPDDANLIREDGGLPVFTDLFRASELASYLKMAKADAIVNAAPQVVNALPLHRPNWTYYGRLLSQGTAALVAAGAQAEVKLIVHASFAALYGDTHGEWADESASISTDSPLFVAAAQAESAVLGGDVPGCVLRAGFNYGPGSQSIQALRQALISRGAVSVGRNPASWIHNADLASAIALCIAEQPAGEIFNVADDNPVSPAEFVDQFADSMGVARPGKGGLPPVLRQALVHPNERALLDISVRAQNTKAKEKLGWTLQYASIAAGIEQTLLAWRAAETV